MSEVRHWLRVVATAHVAGADTWVANGVAVQRVTGGANNALYRLEVDGQSYAGKLCVADERRRAAREHGALRLLQAARLDIAPEPSALDESCALLPFPTVVYRWLAGEPLGPSPTAQQLAALLDSIQQMHTLSPRPGSTGLASHLTSANSTLSWPSTAPGWQPASRTDRICTPVWAGWWIVARRPC